MALFRKLRTFESLSLKDYRLLWLGQLASSMGSQMDLVTRNWLLYELTGSPLQLGLLGATRGIPYLFFGMVAGAVADRYGRKSQMIISQSLSAILNAALAILVFTGYIVPWHIYVTGFLEGIAHAFQQPARTTLISDLVERKHLLNAISLSSAAANVSRSTGPAIGGILIHAFGVWPTYLVQAVLFASATQWTGQIRVPGAVPLSDSSNAAASQSFWGSIREGISYILSHRIILALMVLGLAPMVLGQPYTSLMPVFAKDIFGGGSGTQGLLLSMIGIGAIIGALGMASFGRRQGSGKFLLVMASGFGLSIAFFSHSPALWMAMVFALLNGLFHTGYRAQNQTIIQMTTPAELRGRVLGVYLLDRGLVPLGSLIAGVLASFLGAPVAVAIMGISCFLLVIAVGILVPGLRKLNLDMA